MSKKKENKRFPFAVWGVVPTVLEELRGSAEEKANQVMIGKGETYFSAHIHDHGDFFVAALKSVDVRKLIEEKGMEKDVAFFIVFREASGRGYGRTFCDVKGLPLRDRSKNKNDKKRVQPISNELQEGVAVEIVSRQTLMRLSHFHAGKQKIFSIRIERDVQELVLSDTLKKRLFSREKISPKIADREISAFVLAQGQVIGESWAKFAPALSTAFLKAHGEGNFFFHENPNIESLQGDLLGKIRSVVKKSKKPRSKPAPKEVEATNDSMATAMKEALIASAVEAAKNRKGPYRDPTKGNRFCTHERYIQLAQEGIINAGGKPVAEMNPVAA